MTEQLEIRVGDQSRQYEWLRWDERNDAIVRERMARFNAIETPRVGDFLEYAGGQVRRIGYVWGDGFDVEWDGFQTTPGGSFYLSGAWVSCSGSMDQRVPWPTVRSAGEKRFGSAWIFHHDLWGGARGVGFQVEFRVWRTSVAVPL